MREFLLHPRSVWLIAAVAFALRLAAGFYFESRLPPGTQFEFGDSDGYWYLGQQIAAGKPYQYRSEEAKVFRMPGYPMVLAPLFVALGPNASPMWGRGVSALLGGVTAALVVWWGSLLFDMRAGLLAGWITAFYPGVVAMGSFVLSEAPFMPLMVTHLALAAAAFRSATGRGFVLLSIAAGLAAAGAIYMRPSWLLFVPFAALVGVALNRKRMETVIHSAIAIAVICVCLAPWWVRNYRITGHFVLTTLQVGASLYDGLNLNADGSSNMWWDNLPVRGIGWSEMAGEYQQNQIFRDYAIDWARENPWRVLQLVAIKFTRMWNVVPNEAMFRSWPVKLLVAATFTPIFLLGCYGVTKYTRLGWPYLLAGLPVLYFTLLHVVFVASIRYREPAMLGLIVLAAAAIVDSRRQTCHPAATGLHG